MMSIRNTFFILCIILLLAVPDPCSPQESATPAVSFDPKDRILVLAPHPDDETLGCAGIIQKAIKRKNPLRVVFLTFGDNNEWAFLEYRKHPVIIPQAVRNMGLVRHKEALAAAKILGLSPNSGELIFLGYPDFGTLGIWYRHWGQRPPLKSMLTNAKAVPYDNAFRPGAAYKGEEILGDIKTIINDFRPTKIFVSHPADHNPDHQSLYLFTKVALWELQSKHQPELGLREEPKVFPYPVHCKGWPRPRGNHKNLSLGPPRAIEDEMQWYADYLDSQEVDRKIAALKAHVSQYKSSAAYLLSFVRSNELFGDFPTSKLHTALDDGHLLLLRASPALLEVPESFTEEERTAYVGIEERTITLDGDTLVCTFKLSRPLAKTVGLSISFFGYRPDISFAKMPKIRIKLGLLTYAVFDQTARLSKETIDVRRQLKTITIRIPLKVLGMPTKFLTNASTHLSNVSLDWVSWRTIEVVYN